MKSEKPCKKIVVKFGGSSLSDHERLSRAVSAVAGSNFEMFMDGSGPGCQTRWDSNAGGVGPVNSRPGNMTFGTTIFSGVFAADG